MRIVTEAEMHEIKIISGQIERPEDQVRRIQKEWGVDKILQRPVNAFLDAISPSRSQSIHFYPDHSIVEDDQKQTW